MGSKGSAKGRFFFLGALITAWFYGAACFQLFRHEGLAGEQFAQEGQTQKNTGPNCTAWICQRPRTAPSCACAASYLGAGRASFSFSSSPSGQTEAEVPRWHIYNHVGFYTKLVVVLPMQAMGQSLGGVLPRLWKALDLGQQGRFKLYSAAGPGWPGTQGQTSIAWQRPQTLTTWRRFGTARSAATSSAAASCSWWQGAQGQWERQGQAWRQRSSRSSNCSSTASTGPSSFQFITTGSEDDGNATSSCCSQRPSSCKCEGALDGTGGGADGQQGQKAAQACQHAALQVQTPGQSAVTAGAVSFPVAQVCGDPRYLTAETDRGKGRSTSQFCRLRVGFSRGNRRCSCDGLTACCRGSSFQRRFGEDGRGAGLLGSGDTRATAARSATPDVATADVPSCRDCCSCASKVRLPHAQERGQGPRGCFRDLRRGGCCSPGKGWPHQGPSAFGPGSGNTAGCQSRQDRPWSQPGFTLGPLPSHEKLNAPRTQAGLPFSYLSLSHTVCKQHDFVSTWHAVSLAHHLAFVVSVQHLVVNVGFYDPRCCTDDVDMPTGQAYGIIGDLSQGSPHAAEGATQDMDRHLGVEPRCCELISEMEATFDPILDNETTLLRSCLRCGANAARTGLRVQWDFSVQFWFPEPHQLTLPTSRDVPRQGLQVASFCPAASSSFASPSVCEVETVSSPAMPSACSRDDLVESGPQFQDSWRHAGSRSPDLRDPCAQLPTPDFSGNCSLCADFEIFVDPVPFEGLVISASGNRPEDTISKCEARPALADLSNLPDGGSQAVIPTYPLLPSSRHDAKFDSENAGWHVGLRPPADSLSGSGLVGSHSFLSKGGSCRTLSGSDGLIPVAEADHAAPATSSKRARLLCNSKVPSADASAVDDDHQVGTIPGANTRPKRFTCFDKAGGAAVFPYPSGIASGHCQYFCLGRTTVLQPLARLLAVNVPTWPTPQIVVSSAALATTHRAVVLLAAADDPPLVVEIGLHHTFASLEVDVVFGLGYPFGTRVVACAANGIRYACDNIIPSTTDFVEVTLQLPRTGEGEGAANRPAATEFGRKQRSTAARPASTTDDAASSSQNNAAATPSPWAERPIPGAPSVPIVATAASGFSSTASFTSFDHAAGAYLLQRQSDSTDEQCVRQAISASYVANPIGRQLVAQVPGWPAPQVIVYEFRAMRTHVACVVVIAGFYETPFVVQVPLASTLHRVLAMTPVGGDLALVRCQVDNAPLHCDAFLPPTADFVFFEVTAKPPEEVARVLQYAPPLEVPRHGLPRIPAIIDDTGTSAGSPMLVRPILRPAAPPIPSDPDSDVFSSSHSGSDFASRLPSFTVFDVIHHVRIIETHGPFSLGHLASVALAHTPEMRGPIGFRLLRNPVAGYPAPHIVIWEEPAPHSRTFPIFHYGAQKGVCTVCVPTRTSAFQVAYLAEQLCALPPHFRRRVARLEASILFDGASADPHAAFEAGAVDTAVYTQYGPTQSVRVTVAPRWRTPFPRHVDLLLPEDVSISEPCNDVVIHSLCAAPVSLWVSPLMRPFQVRDAAASALGAVFGACTRLPVLCPVQAGMPLHIGLLRPEDAPHNAHFAIVDVRRRIAPPRPLFCFTRLPDCVDLRWLRDFLKRTFPEAPLCAWAFFDQDSLQCAIQPTARTHLITALEPLPLRPGEGPLRMPAIVDTLDLLAFRPGWFQAVARYPGASALPAYAPRAMPVLGSGDMVRLLPSPADDDVVTLWDCSLAPLDEIECLQEVIVHSLVSTPTRTFISKLWRPEQVEQFLLRLLDVPQASLCWPTWAPCMAGDPVHFALVPLALGDTFLLVDARRVHPALDFGLWLLPAPAALQRESLMATFLDGRSVAITPAGFRLNGIRMLAAFSPAVGISTVTLQAGSLGGMQCVTNNLALLARLPGFCAVSPVTSTSTTTTTAPAPTGPAPTLDPVSDDHEECVLSPASCAVFESEAAASLADPPLSFGGDLRVFFTAIGLQVRTFRFESIRGASIAGTLTAFPSCSI